MRRRKKAADLFPGPLAEFHEEDWPQLEGECLGHYTCHGAGYGTECVPRPGEYCGQLCYESYERDYPDEPERLAAVKCSDAYTRWHQARLNWLGKDHPMWFEEFLSNDHHRIRFPSAGGGPG